MSLKISTRLYLLIALFAIGCGSISATLIWFGNARAVAARLKGLEQLVEVAVAVLDAHKTFVDKGLLDEPEARKRAYEVISNMRYNSGDYFFARDINNVTIVNPGMPSTIGQRRVDTVDRTGFAWGRELAAIVERMGTGYVTYTIEKPGTKTEVSKTVYMKGYAPWKIAVATGVYMDDLIAERNRAMLEAGLATLGLTIVISIVTLLTTRSIVKPLNRLSAAMNLIVQGRDISVAQEAARADEIGGMANSVLEFQEAGKAKKRAEADAAEQRAAAEEERRIRESERADVERRTGAMVASLAKGLTHLAKGDLTFSIDTPFHDSLEQLRCDFNNALARLNETMQGVTQSCQAMASGTDEISAAADDLSRRTEQQAASIEETAASLGEIVSNVEKAAEGASHASDVVAAAKQDAEQADQVVRRTVAAMSGIEKSAQQINQIISVIDEIAFQTNLLALNAGVEAARAGDAGRGFAVVASEVRALAQRSATAAKEIKALIGTSAAQVTEGVDLVSKTGDALARILTQVNAINDIVTGIAGAAREQANGLAQVNVAVNEMDKVTQQNAAMVEQSTAASRKLSEEARHLSQGAAFFRTSRVHSPHARAA